MTADAWDLLERLDAAALDREHIHNDLCTLYDERGPAPCSCGIPALLEDAAAWMREQAAASVIEQSRAA